MLAVMGSFLTESRAQAIGAAPQLDPVTQISDRLVLAQSKACTTKRVSPQIVAVAPSGKEVFRASSRPIISAKGNLLAYESSAVVESEDNPWFNSMVVVAESLTGKTEQVDVNNEGQPANDISSLADMTLDGRFVAFTSYATNLVNGAPQGSLFIRDRLRRVTELVPLEENLRLSLLVNPLVALSADGRYIAFGNLDIADVYVYDRAQRTTELVSLEPENPSRYSLAPDISADGRYVSFTSGLYGQASNNVFVRDRTTGVTQLVSAGLDGQPAEGTKPAISANGRYVTFVSSASKLVEGDTNNADDVFVHDQVQKVTERISVSSTGQQANGFSFEPAIAPGGYYVSFKSEASNLVVGDTNNVEDVFVRHLKGKFTERDSISSTGEQANSASSQPTVSFGSHTVAFTSDATNLVAEDTNGVSDVYIRTCRN
jgi:hypothetical protein